MDELLSGRYGRQVRIPQIGEQGQRRLLDATVLVIGIGGLGSPAALYLAAAGVGRLLLSDFDRVEESNLQRQIIHGVPDLGEPKAHSAQRAIERINPRCQVEAMDWQLDDDELQRVLARADLVLDCSDNFETRYQVNRASVRVGRPLVSGAAIRMEGQVASFIPGSGGPCYQCLYPADGSGGESCAMEGILAPVVGVIGSLQAAQAVLILAGHGASVSDRLLMVDVLNWEFRTLRIPADPACPVCGTPG